VEDSKDFFAFKWEDSQKRRKQQYRWTVVPEELTASANSFG
jgi:hypothetical protein